MLKFVLESEIFYLKTKLLVSNRQYWKRKAQIGHTTMVRNHNFKEQKCLHVRDCVTRFFCHARDGKHMEVRTIPQLGPQRWSLVSRVVKHIIRFYSALSV